MPRPNGRLFHFRLPLSPLTCTRQIEATPAFLGPTLISQLPSTFDAQVSSLSSRERII